MNTKKITLLLLLSILTVNAINADTTKPDPESFYEQTCHLAKEMFDGFRNLNPINAGIAFIAALAVNGGLDYALPKTSNQLEKERIKAIDLIYEQADKQHQAARKTCQKYQKYQEYARVGGKWEIAFNRAEELNSSEVMAALNQVKQEYNEAIKALNEARKATNEAEEIYQKLTENSDVAREVIHTEKIKNANQVNEKFKKAKETAMPSLLRTLFTRTFSVATFINIYNSLQIQQGKKPINIPLLHYVDFSATMANSSWGVKINITGFLEYLGIY